MKNLAFPMIKKTKIILLIGCLTTLTNLTCATTTEMDQNTFLLKIDYIQDANSLTLASGKKIRLAGIRIPDFYGKNTDWIGLNEKQLYDYSSEAKDLIRNIVYVTELKKKWFHSKLVKSERLSRPIRIELEPANARNQHKASKKSKETLVYAYVLLPDDDSNSKDILHYARLPDVKFIKKRVVFINEALLKEGYGLADKQFADTQYTTLKQAEEYAIQTQSPGKSKKYSTLRLRSRISEMLQDSNYAPETIRSGRQIYLNNGIDAYLLGIITPEPFGKNIRFTAPYGNLISVASQKSKQYLNTLLEDSKNKNALKPVQFKFDPTEQKRKKKQEGNIFGWTYTEHVDTKLTYLNNCCEDRIQNTSMLPDWASTEPFNMQLLNLEIILSGHAYPLQDLTSQYQNLMEEAFEYARSQKLNLHSDEFQELHYLSDLTKTIKGKIAPTKHVGTPRRREGGDNNSWEGQSNFNG